ncbi:MAG: hypothetical protein LBU68_00850 [Rickettsiales bacterium]|jgi:2-polyprenyl-3-methyl-5-hydroxy-6-metoxy-1,4-benzoquinol methylase|nr:hypothetical protein [Rickettsiales bacterium]
MNNNIKSNDVFEKDDLQKIIELIEDGNADGLIPNISEKQIKQIMAADKNYPRTSKNMQTFQNNYFEHHYSSSTPQNYTSKDKIQSRLFDDLIIYAANGLSRDECLGCPHRSSMKDIPGQKCLEEIYNPSEYPKGKKLYNCPVITKNYVLRYLNSFASQMRYIFERQFAKQSILDKSTLRVLSLGCGASPDLIALLSLKDKGFNQNILYTGVDLERSWQGLHNRIQHRSCYDKEFGAQFSYENAIDFMQKNKNSYDIVIVQNILSHFKRTDNIDFVPVFMELLKNNIIPNMSQNGLLIISDIEYNGFRWINIAKDILSKYGEKTEITYWGDYKNDGWILHENDKVLFNYPIDMEKFEPLKQCTRTIQFMLRT